MGTRTTDDRSAGSPRPPRRYVAVAEEILRSVAMGHLSIGDRLPDERALSLRCGVSRSTVREALLALELAGVIDVRPGAGCYLIGGISGAGSGITLRVDALPRQMLDVRVLLEPTAAGLCALSIRSLDLAHLKHILAEAEEESENLDLGNTDRFLELNLGFHRDLNRACGNDVLADAVGQMVDASRHPLWALVDSIDVRNLESRRLQLHEHRTILEAIASGQPETASAAMADHLERIKLRIFGSDHARPKVIRTRRGHAS